MSKDYTLKFYKGYMRNENDETYKFQLAARSNKEAEKYLEKYVRNHSNKYHLIPGENDIAEIRVTEVSLESYGKSYDYEVIN